MGTIVLGKLESGVVYKGQSLTLMPNKVHFEHLFAVFFQVISDHVTKVKPNNIMLPSQTKLNIVESFEVR